MVDAAHRIGLDARDVLTVTDAPDQGDLFAARDVGSRADALYSLDDGRYVVIGGRRLHHDQHQGTFRAFKYWYKSARLAV